MSDGIALTPEEDAWRRYRDQRRAQAQRAAQTSEARRRVLGLTPEAERQWSAARDQTRAAPASEMPAAHAAPRDLLSSPPPGRQQPRDLLAPQQERAPTTYSWPQAAVSGVFNAPGSAVRFAQDMAYPVMHPVKTAKAVGNLALGTLQMAIPGRQGGEIYPEAIGQFLLERYGSEDAVKRTLAEDPVGLAADLSMILTAGGSAGARAPGVVGRASRAVQRIGRAADPLRLPATVGRALSYPAGMHTGTGARALQEAGSAGARGGSAARALTSNMRGQVGTHAVVDQARSAVRNLRAQRALAYQQGMLGVRAVQGPLSFTAVDRAIAQVRSAGFFHGKPIRRSAAKTWEKIDDLVADWQQSDPAIYHTAAGFDALKQAIGDIRDSTEWGTPSRYAADQVYHAVRGEIARQAPSYADVMRDYEVATQLIGEMEHTLSLNPGARVDTTLRKLQSLMRNNANTNYGRRMELGEMLTQAGAPDLIPSLAGQSLNTWTPRGLQSATSPTIGAAAYLSTGSPVPAAALMGLSSPRLMGEAAYAAGRAYSPVARVPSPLVGGLFQLGRGAREVNYRTGGGF